MSRPCKNVSKTFIFISFSFYSPFASGIISICSWIAGLFILISFLLIISELVFNTILSFSTIFSPYEGFVTFSKGFSSIVYVFNIMILLVCYGSKFILSLLSFFYSHSSIIVKGFWSILFFESSFSFIILSSKTSTTSKFFFGTKFSKL